LNIGRPIWLTAGILSFAMGTIGIVLPILPTVPFYLLAAVCFARSHPEWERRLLDHPHWGPPIRRWRERRAISRKAKLSAIGAMSAGVLFTGFTVGYPWVLISVGVLAICGPWIWTRNE
jgi:uncharacterized membrane protein YbaN (DUF454 family)